ncbi:MAG: LemA family protein [Candidatus Aenigmatarchaeota archaeon]
MALSKPMIALIVVAVVAISLVLMVVGLYNNFVVLDQNVLAKWSEVENQYQRQADLIPNLVSTVSSAVGVETKFVTDVTAARSKWQESETLFDKDTAGVQMSNGITALVNAVATAENYPVLQANKQYVALTDELSGTQNRIAVARGRYIESIQSYNTATRTFPGNMLSGMFGFTAKEYYQAELSSMETPSLGSGELPS